MANRNLFIAVVAVGVALAFWSFSFANLTPATKDPQVEVAVNRISLPRDSIILNGKEHDVVSINIFCWKQFLIYPRTIPLHFKCFLFIN